jgi:hypothetical protein
MKDGRMRQLFEINIPGSPSSIEIAILYEKGHLRK